MSRLLLPDDFLGATSSSHLNITPRSDGSSTKLPASFTGTGTTLLSPTLTPGEEDNATFSVSSDSVSLPTQVEVRPEPVVTKLAEKLTDVGLEDVADKIQEVQKPQSNDSSVEVESEVKGSVGARSPASTSKPVVAKEEVLQDLRVFELNSDSGKSTPSNNGKKGRVTF